MRFIIGLILSCFLIANVYADDFAMSSTAFLDEGVLPTLYTCDGKNISPQIAWVNPPSDTQSFAVVMSDLDAPKGILYHWIVYNIPAKEKNLPEDLQILPKGTVTISNSFKKSGYSGPCPPKGSLHHYLITLYALKSVIHSNKKEIPDILEEIKKHSLKEIKLTTAYARWF